MIFLESKQITIHCKGITMPKSLNKLAGFFLGLIFSCSVFAAGQVTLNPNHPDRYVVVKGDTLWDISERFLNEPWRWPDVWQANPQVANPHLIYPGDTLTLSFVDGKPQISVASDSSPTGDQASPAEDPAKGSTVKLTPQVRATAIPKAIPSIPIDAIQQFLTRPYVVDKRQLDRAPYVVDFADEHIAGSPGLKAYVRAIRGGEKNTKFDVVRPGKPYRDARTGEILGYEALFIASSELQRTGDPATVLLTSSELEVLKGDRLFKTKEDKPLATFFPSPPKKGVNGSIIAVLNGVNQIGQYNVVVVDRGQNDGLEDGNVLAIDQRGETVRDTVTENSRDTVKLPNERAGTLMIFRTFPRVSFGLVMRATKALHVNDVVRNP
jgi:LysM domain